MLGRGPAKTASTPYMPVNAQNVIQSCATSCKLAPIWVMRTSPSMAVVLGKTWLTALIWLGMASRGHDTGRENYYHLLLPFVRPPDWRVHETRTNLCCDRVTIGSLPAPAGSSPSQGQR